MCATCYVTAGPTLGAAAALGLPGLAAITVGRLTVWRGTGEAEVGPSADEEGADRGPVPGP